MGKATMDKVNNNVEKIKNIFHDTMARWLMVVFVLCGLIFTYGRNVRSLEVLSAQIQNKADLDYVNKDIQQINKKIDNLLFDMKEMSKSVNDLTIEVRSGLSRSAVEDEDSLRGG